MSEALPGSRTRLEEISIRGLGVIDNATIEFAPGLNVITGETGAGKTMVLTALALVLGGKTDSDLVRKGSDRLSVTGRFWVGEKPFESLAGLLSEHDVQLEDGEFLMARTINPDGKSRANLSGVATTAAALSSLALELIEIHGQHGTLQLSKASRQRELLDRFGGQGTRTLLADYQKKLAELQVINLRIKELERSLADRDNELTQLGELVGEYARLRPSSDELVNVDQEISKLESVEDIRIALSNTLGALDGEDSGASFALSISRKAVQPVREKDPKIEGAAAKIEDAFYQINDARSEIRAFLEDLAADPIRLEELISRRAALRNFAKRFGRGATLQESFDFALMRAESAKQRMQDLSGGEDRMLELRKEGELKRKEVIAASRLLSARRAELAEQVNEEVTRELHALSMPKAKFNCVVTNLLDEESRFDSPSFGQFGNDEIEMLFTAHAGGTLLPISKAASGGELSRLMLALEVVVAQSSPRGTYLFDEIDAGIGGKAALEVGKRLKRLAEHAQIIVVTHLPQVAIWGDRHLRVLKDSAGSITESSVIEVRGVERESEIARMLSGLEESEHAQEHARELLDLVKS